MATVDDLYSAPDAIAPLSREQMDREAAEIKPIVAPAGSAPSLRSDTGQAANDAKQAANDAKQAAHANNPYTAVLLGKSPTVDLEAATGGGIRGQQGSGRVVDNYSELQRYLEDEINSAKVPTQEQMQRAARRHRSRQIVNSVADAGRALANWFATVDYAPNGYVPGHGAVEQQQARYDRMVAQNEAARQRHQNNLLMLGKLREDREAKAAARDRAAAEQANARAMMQLRLAEFDLARAKDERDAELHALNVKLKNGEISKAEAEADEAKVRAKYAEAQQKADLARTNAQANQANAAASKSKAEAGAVAQEGYPAFDRYGNKHWFKNEKAAENFSRNEGTFELYRRTKVEKQTGGIKGDITTTTSEIAGGWSKNPTEGKGMMPGVGDSNNNNETKMPGIR